MSARDQVEFALKGNEDFGIQGYQMTQPHIPGKAWAGNMFSKDKIERDFISTVQTNAKKNMGAVSPSTYKPEDKGGV